MTDLTRPDEPALERDLEQDPSRQTRKPQTLPEPPRHGWFVPLLRRLHFYAGIFVGPFIVIAALTGALYAFSPQLERAVYSEALTASTETADHLPLAEQVAAAEDYVSDDARLEAVRPAPEPGETTRVIYHHEDLPGASHETSRSIFVDPATGEIRGDEQIYGTSGALPLRTEIAQMHRHLFLGDWGRIYSELAASWLGIVIIAGFFLWVSHWRRARRSARRRRGLLLPDHSASGLRRTRSWHASLGIWLGAGGLFLAATGITWSTYGGSNVTDLRSALNWETPSVETQLNSGHSPEDSGGHIHPDHASPSNDHAEDTPTADPAAIDDVLHAGREAGFNSTHIEIALPSGEEQAWSMEDISQRSPAPDIQSVAVDPATHEVTDVLAWDDYPFMAQLAQWGIWLHMGTLFGLANQVLLFGLAVGIAGLVILGYRMWWQRRPTRGNRRVGRMPESGSLRRAPWWGKVLVVGSLGLVGWFLPVLGVSLAGFVLLDIALNQLAKRNARPSSERSARAAHTGR